MSFRHTSKSSSRSSSPRKSSSNPEESSKLYRELESLKQAVASLKISIESRDVAIGKLAREKEKLYVELKGAQRTTRNLRQQLVDEREIHSKEKQYLVEEIARLSRKEEFDCCNSIQHYSNDEYIIDSLQDQLLAKDEIICNICAKFLKLKTSKSALQKKLRRLKTHTRKTYESIILLLQDNKGIMDNLFEKILRFSTVSQRSKKYLKLLRMNIKLHYENTQLKMSLSHRSRAIKDHDTEVHEENYHDALFHHGSRNTIAVTEGSETGPSPIRHKIKWRPPKLKYKWHSPALISAFYNERKPLSAQLQETLMKSTSMPCLRHSYS